jgi:2-C-methyl-D-erythritol 4-phosphate cytidylyltransferase
LSPDIVRRVISTTQKRGVALAAWPLSDTLKLTGKAGRVKKTVSRDQFWCAQTPQGFRRAIAEKCLLHPSPTATDDAELAERRGFPVSVVVGSPTNIKVTFPRDLEIAKVLKGL